MNPELEKILETLGKSLPQLASNGYYVKLDDFSPEDDAILREFRMKEFGESERPHRHAPEVKEFLNKPEEYASPKTYLQSMGKVPDARQLIPFLESMVGKKGIIESGIEGEMEFLQDSFSHVNNMLIDTQIRLHEYVLMYAKQIADEKHDKPSGVVAASNGRDEIFRRIFPSKELFESYYTSRLKIDTIMFTCSYNLINGLMDYSENLSKSGDPMAAGIAMGFRMGAKINKMPPPEAMGKVVKEEIKYLKNRAERIYSSYEGPLQARFVVTGCFVKEGHVIKN